MKIIEVARQQKDLLNEGIAYIAVWQVAQSNGKRSWFTESFHPIDEENEAPVFDEEQKARLAEIAALDENAVLLNGYYHSWIGSADDPLNAASIAKGLENHYLMHNALIKDYLAGEDESIEPGTAEEPTECKIEPAECADETTESDTLTIELPLDNGYADFTPKKENLRRLIESKATLIKAALGDDGIGELPIEFTAEGTVKFEWLKLPAETTETESDRAVTFGTIGDPQSVRTAWTEFFCHLVKFAKKAQRVTAKDGELSDNPKFDFRVFLVKIGMNSAELKVARKTLLRNLEGSTAFKSTESEKNWKERHLPKKEGADNE